MNVTYQIPGRTPENERDDVSRYWRERFPQEPYYAEGEHYEDYEPAYLAGHEARVRNVEQAYEQVEAELRDRWEAGKGSQSLAWSKARHAVRRAWEHAEHWGRQTG
ncbi:MAG TPA: hypothetical protein VM687_03190 [Stenotrophomonas sp.]|nr:hypothetical protein [Stenotrophomonas sp.]